MKTFDELCAMVENLSGEEYAAAIAGNMLKLLPVLNSIAPDGNGRKALATFLIASVYADGEVNDAEYLLMKPTLDICFGKDFDMQSIVDFVNSFADDSAVLREITDGFVDSIGTVSAEMKSDLVMLCLLVCAVDGKISNKEKSYIIQLLKD